jgi:hypothetical protein
MHDTFVGCVTLTPNWLQAIIWLNHLSKVQRLPHKSSAFFDPKCSREKERERKRERERERERETDLRQGSLIQENVLYEQRNVR